jgi:uncharacterized protein YdeI (YjbR/CyaY-like superfamily)
VATHPAEHKGRRVVVAHTVEEWRDWLRQEGPTSGTVWLTVWKKAAGPDKLTYDDVVDEALCHGWIDSTINGFDETSTLLMVAPRKKGSVWSAVNKARIERLVAEGRMQPAGRAVIDAAIADGSWTILDPVEAMEEPDDLVAAIDAAGVRDVWESWTPGRRKQVLYRLVMAKTPPTRAKRIAEAIAELQGG